MERNENTLFNIGSVMRHVRLQGGKKNVLTLSQAEPSTAISVQLITPHISNC